MFGTEMSPYGGERASGGPALAPDLLVDRWGPGLRIGLALGGLLATICAGAVGYTLTEPTLDFGDALWLALTTTTTVGYGDLAPTTTEARFVTVGILLGGFFWVSLATASFVELLVEGGIARMIGSRRLEQKIGELSDHYIICGYGRMGHLVVREIQRFVKLVVIERDEQELRALRDQKVLYLAGDATDEEVLARAGIERARGLVSVVASDAENVFIVLTAREMNRSLEILARSIDERSERKLMRAGASKVISPYLIGGLRLAQAIVKPAVVDFLEFILHNDDLDVHVEEVPVAPGAPLAESELQSSGISGADVIVLGIKRSGGQMVFNPSRETVIHGGDTLIVMGPTPGVKKIAARASLV